MYDADNVIKNHVQVATSELLELESQLGTKEEELNMAKDRAIALEKLAKTSRQRVLEAEAAQKQVRSELEQLQIEVDVSRRSMRQSITSTAQKAAAFLRPAHSSPHRAITSATLRSTDALVPPPCSHPHC